MKILHISDLHIGRDVANYIPSRFDGFAEVEYDALRQLACAARRSVIARQNTTKARGAPACIVSGDLSATGDGQELANAFSFLASEVKFSFGAPKIGLSYNSSNLNAILGNHDIWGGQTSLLAWVNAEKKKARAAALFNEWENVRRWAAGIGRSRGYIDTNGLRIRVYLIDSTLPGFANVFARGRVAVSALNKLRRMVEEDEWNDSADDSISHCLRIAVLHHPIKTKERHILSMLLENASEVQCCLNDLNFGVVLSGHVHEANVQELTAGMFQITCGSSSQITRERNNELSFFLLDIDGCSVSEECCNVEYEKYSRSDLQGTPFTQVDKDRLPVRIIKLRSTGFTDQSPAMRLSAPLLLK